MYAEYASPKLAEETTTSFAFPKKQLPQARRGLASVPPSPGDMSGFGKHDRQYNQGAVQMGGYEAAGGRDGSLTDDEIYRSVTASAALGNAGNYTSAVVSDGSGRVFGATAHAQQGGYNGAEMDEAMNNDMTGVTEAGYADKIATGIDRVQGDYSTLPKHIQQLFIKLRAMAKSEGIDLERTFQDAGGTRFGTVSKRIFMSALGIAFVHYTFSEKEYDDIVGAYGCGGDDIYNGGKLQVAWRDFVNDVLSAEVIQKEFAYTDTDTDETDAGYSDAIATGIDRIKGGFYDLPIEVQNLMHRLRDMAKIEGLNLEYTMQQAGGTRFGTIGKRHFLSALTICFHHYTFTPEIYKMLTDHYGVGAKDFAEGGLEQVAWRDFVNDVLSSKEYDDPQEVEIALTAKYDPKANAAYNTSALAGVFTSKQF